MALPEWRMSAQPLAADVARAGALAVVGPVVAGPVQHLVVAGPPGALAVVGLVVAGSG